MIKPRLHELVICRHLLEDEAVHIFLESFSAPTPEGLQYDFAARLIAKAEEIGLSGNLLRAYFIHRLAHDGNIAAQITELSNGCIGASLRRVFIRDMDILAEVLQNAPSTMLGTDILDDYTPTHAGRNEAAAYLTGLMDQAHTSEEIAEALLTYYRRYGYGDIASYRAFRWDKKKHLIGIRHFESMQLADIIGY